MTLKGLGWVDPNSTMVHRNISAMIEAELNTIAEKAFEKNPSPLSGPAKGASVGKERKRPTATPNRNIQVMERLISPSSRALGPGTRFRLGGWNSPHPSTHWRG